MPKNIKLCVVLLWLIAVSWLAGLTTNSAAQQTGSLQGEPALTEQERRGKAFYLRGATGSGKEATAVLNEVEVPASTITCAGCHGADGLGIKEGGITPGNITWQELTKPYGHTHDNQRKHGPYNEAAFVRAVTAGVDPTGNRLAVAMPRYQMQASDMADLLAYLKRITTDRDPGLTETSIKVGTLLPSKGPSAEAGQAMREMLVSYFDELNRRGGLYNRKIELTVGEATDDVATTVANARRLIETEKVFALVGGFTAGADKELSALVGEKEVPFIAPTTLFPQIGFPLNRYLFYLHAGMKDQARVLINFAASKPELRKPRAAILYPQNEGNFAEVGTAIEEQAQRAGWIEIDKIAYSAERFDAKQLADKLQHSNRDVIFFLGSDGKEISLIKQLEALKYNPMLFLLGTLSGRDLLDAVPTIFKDKIYLAYPTVPADVTDSGLMEYRRLVEKYNLAVRHSTAQLSALASAKILVEGFTRAGRDVSREKLVTALEGLYEFDTAMTPRVTYGPNRRTGVAGAYIVAINPERKTLVPASGWIKAN